METNDGSKRRNNVEITVYDEVKTTNNLKF